MCPFYNTHICDEMLLQNTVWYCSLFSSFIEKRIAHLCNSIFFLKKRRIIRIIHIGITRLISQVKKRPLQKCVRCTHACKRFILRFVDGLRIFSKNTAWFCKNSYFVSHDFFYPKTLTRYNLRFTSMDLSFMTFQQVFADDG